MPLNAAATGLLGSLAASSLGFYGQILFYLAGPIPLSDAKFGKNGFNPAIRVKLWNLAFKRTAPVMIACGLLTPLINLYTTYRYPSASRPWLLLSSFSLLLANPYTVFTLMTTNNALFAIHDKIKENSTTGQLELPEKDAKRALELLKEWTFWANGRVVFFALGYIGVLAALAVEAGVWNGRL